MKITTLLGTWRVHRFFTRGQAIELGFIDDDARHRCPTCGSQVMSKQLPKIPSKDKPQPATVPKPSIDAAKQPKKTV